MTLPAFRFSRSCTPILRRQLTFLACSFKPGAVPSLVTFPFSISAAQSAAPTVFVKANRMLATGTNSSKTAATPKLQHIVSKCPEPPTPLHQLCALMTYLVYAALYSSICFCLCVLFHCFN